MATAKTSVVATDQAAQQEFFDNEHPVSEDLSNIPKQAYEMVAQLVWNALSDRNGVLSGLTCTFAGGDAIVTVGDGSLIMQGNMAQHASANYTHTGAAGTWYLYARPQEEADTTTADDRSFVVANRPIPFRGVSPATGETPDGSKKTFRLQHYRVITQTFRAYVDGDAVGCTVTNSTGTGGYAEAHFVDAPGGATTVTFDYDQETGGYGTVQSVDTQNKVSLEFSSNAAAPPRAGYVCLCRYTVVGVNVTAVTETGFKEWLFSQDPTIGELEPTWPKKLIDFLYDREEGDATARRNATRFSASHNPRNTAVGITGVFAAASKEVQVTVGVYGNIDAGMTLFATNGGTDYRFKILQKYGTDKLLIDGNAGFTATQAATVYNALGTSTIPFYEAFFLNLHSSDLLHQVANITRSYFVNGTPANTTNFPYYSAATGGWDAAWTNIFQLAPADTLQYNIEYVRFRARKGVKRIRVMIHASFFYVANSIKLTAFMGRASDPTTEPTWADATERTITWGAHTNAGWYQFDDADGATLANDLVFDDALTEDTDIAVAVIAEKVTHTAANNILNYAGLQVYEILVT